MNYRVDTSRPKPCPRMNPDGTCDACRGSRGCLCPKEFEMVRIDAPPTGAATTASASEGCTDICGECCGFGMYAGKVCEECDGSGRIKVNEATMASASTVKHRDVLAICDAYESGIGHGLQHDGHDSGSIFGNPVHGVAYEIGYDEGKRRATAPSRNAAPLELIALSALEAARIALGWNVPAGARRKALDLIRAALTQQSAAQAPADTLLPIPHTFGAFSASFYVAKNRKPTGQEIFDAGMRSGRDIQWPNRAAQASHAGADTEKQAARYRWLRDKSEPGICAFYLSVGQAFKDVKFTKETVDDAIDAQIAAMSAATEQKEKP